MGRLMMRRKAILIGWVLLLWAIFPMVPLLAAPWPQVAGRVLVGQVDTTAFPRLTLYVSVLDDRGFPVLGLQRADFSVTEEGQEVDLVDFSGLDQRRPVDVVFVFDSTSSMGTWIDAVKAYVVGFATALQRQGRDYRLGLVTFGDEVRGVYNADGSLTGNVEQFQGWIEQLQPEGGGDMPENAYGAIQQASAMSFRPDAQRILILITDAGPHRYGDAPDEGAAFDDPDLELRPTLDLLRERGATVYAVAIALDEYFALADETGGQFYDIGGDFTEIIEQLGAAIAQQYRLVYRSPRPAFDGAVRQIRVTVVGVGGETSYVAPTQRRPGMGGGFFDALRTPLDISTDPAVVGTNLFLAILIALLFGLTSTLLNDTVAANPEALAAGFFGRVATGLKRAGQAIGRLLGPLGLRGRRTGTYLQVALFVVLTALTACFLDPSFRFFSWAGLGLFFSMLFSVGLVNLAYEGTQVFAARRFRLEAAIKLNPLGILVAIVCVLFSRLVGFVPGYLYGIPGGYVLGSAVELSRRREAAIGGAGLGAAAVLAFLAWGLTVPTALLQQDMGSAGLTRFFPGLVGVIQAFLLTVFFVGLEAVFLELFPLGPTDGAALFRWNKLVWGLSFAVAAFAAFHTLLTPESAYLDTVRSHSLQLLLALLALYSLLAVGLWFLLEGRRRPAAARPCTACGRENDPQDHFCIYCGTPLPPPGRRQVSRQGLAMVAAIAFLWLGIIVAIALAALGVG